MGLLTDEELALDPYKILNLEITSTDKEIKKSYRLLALKWHPDKNQTSEAVIKFREIELSRGILEDVAKRRFVDEKLEGERRRKAKMAAFDKKRKVLVDDLIQREEEAKKAKSDAARRKQEAAEEERIRDEGKRLVEEARKRAAASKSADKDSHHRHNHQPQPTSTTSSAHHNGYSNQQNGESSRSAHSQPSSQPRQPRPPIEANDLTLILTVPSTSSLPSSPTEIQSLLEERYGGIETLIMPPIPQGESNGDGIKKKKQKSRKAIVEFQKGNLGGCWACFKDHQEPVDSTGDSVGSDKRIGQGVRVKWATGTEPEWVKWAEENLITSNTSNGSQGTSHQPSMPYTTSQAGNGYTNGHKKDEEQFEKPTFSTAPNFTTTTMDELLNSQKKRKEEKKIQEDFESMTLFKMRQAERVRLEEEIRAREEEELD